MTLPIQIAVLIAVVLLWALGLRVFLLSGLSTRHKIGWTAFLITIGLAIGFLLPAPSIGRKFILLLITLPVVAAVDLTFLKPRRTLSFWLRACSYEVCTVFGVAWLARALLDRIDIIPLLSS